MEPLYLDQPLRGATECALSASPFVALRQGLFRHHDECRSFFQDNGFPKERLFYTQGDYGLWQCSVPCHDATYDNYDTVRRMVAEQKAMRVPRELVPHCPRCGEPMGMNLRADSTFVEDAGWHEAAKRYQEFLRAHQTGRVLYWEFGVGANTPGIIKYPFWALTKENPAAVYCVMNRGEAVTPQEIAAQSILVDEDIDTSLKALQKAMERSAGHGD